MSKKLSPFYTDKKTADAILAAAKDRLAQAADGKIASADAAGVSSQFQNTCQFKLTTDWKEISASNFVASGEKFVPLRSGAEKRPYPTTIYAYGDRPATSKDSLITATRRANQWVLLLTGSSTTAAPSQYCTVILPICRAINPNATGDWGMPFANVLPQTQHNSRTHYAAQCGYVARDGKSYEPSIASIENEGEENEVIHYHKNLRVSSDVVPRLEDDGTGTLVLQPEGVTNINAHYIVVNDDQTEILQRPVIVYVEDGEAEGIKPNEWKPWETGFQWETTTDVSKAWLDYDLAACPALDYSEVLVPGERVKVVRAETHAHNGQKIRSGPPVNFTHTVKSGNNNTFQWNAVNGAEQYQLQRNTNYPHNDVWQNTASQPGLSTSYTNSFSAMAGYVIRVRVMVNDEWSDWSEPVSFMTSDPNFSIPWEDTGEQPVKIASAAALVSSRVTIVEPPQSYNVEFEGTSDACEFGVWNKERMLTNNQDDVIQTTVDIDFNIGSGGEPYDYWGFDVVDLLPDGLASWDFVQIAAYPKLEEIQNESESPYIDDSHPSRPILTDVVNISNTACNTRAYGLWYKKDKNGVRYPILCNIESLTYGTCIETRKVNCYVHDPETNECVRNWTIFKFQINRDVDRLVLPTVHCAVSCAGAKSNKEVVLP